MAQKIFQSSQQENTNRKFQESSKLPVPTSRVAHHLYVPSHMWNIKGSLVPLLCLFARSVCLSVFAIKACNVRTEGRKISALQTYKRHGRSQKRKA